MEEKEAGRHLTTDEFVRILNGTDLNRLRILNLAGSAEPLLNPDIFSILDVCRKKKLIVEFITNGMLLTPQISKQIAGFSSGIHISFGGSKKETFESIRNGSDFELVCENIRTIGRIKKECNQRYPLVWLNPILMKRNIHELPGIIELAKELGCQGVSCSHLTVNSPELIEESLFFHKETGNHFLHEASELARRYKIAIIRPESFSLEPDCNEKRNKTEAWKKCRFLWNHAIVGLRGIEPCSSNKVIDFDGDVIRNKFTDIWNNDWYADMRYRLLTGTPPQYCKNCTDPSVKDPDHISSYFKEEILSDAFDYVRKNPKLSQKNQLEKSGVPVLSSN